ncbi:hypothetical protein BGZ80_004585 [Entomortierella chlamydospora]|uniref:Serine aminopeptidase S33 domain-containing protein n=1 Tax=Entomortierella chlamydospora TaxID=101097 RepID=A0A9P6N1D7_9FUNG|nr:hypothetical protein BGZ80_004585 [Entomortierella chlamydospora]
MANQATAFEDKWVKAEDGHDIFTRTWFAVGDPIASVVFVHGFGEHIARYDHVFVEFNKAGFQVSAFDQRGAGETGKRSNSFGDSGGYAKAIPDITEALKRGKIEGLPLFLMGHSMGGGLVLNYDSFGPLRTELSGLIASAPFVLAAPPSRPYNLTATFVATLARIVPWLKIPVRVQAKFISRDPEQVALYISDPLIKGISTTRGLTDMLTNGHALLTSRYKDITPNVPILICHGTADSLTDQHASKEFADKIQR